MLLVLAAVAAVLVFSQGCGEEEEQSDTTAAMTAPEVVLTEDWIASRAGSKIGSPNLVRQVTITENGDDRSVLIEVDRPEVCHDGAVVGTLSVFAQNMLGIIYNKFPEVSDVEIIMYGIDQGVVSDDVAMSVMVSRESAQSIDWFEYDEVTMFDLSDEVFMHDKIRASYELEGALPYDQQT